MRAFRNTIASLTRAGFAGGAAFASTAILCGSAGGAEFAYKYAHNTPVTPPLHLATVATWQRVERATNGRLSVQTFPNSVLGGDAAMLEQPRSLERYAGKLG